MLTTLILFVEAFLRCAPAVALFLFTFQGYFRYDTKKIIALLSMYVMFTMLFPTLMFELLHEETWIPIYTILHFIITMIASLFLVNFSYDRILLVCLILDNYMDAISLLRDSLGNYFDSLLTTMGYFPLSLWIRCIILLVSFPLMILFCVKLLRPLVTYDKTAPFHKYLWTIPACFLFMYHLCINPQKLSEVASVFNPVPITVMLIWNLGTFFIYTLVIRMLQETLMKEEIEQQLERAALTSSIQMKYYESLLSQVKKNRKVRHDFRHQIFMIKQYCDEAEYDKLSAYLDEYVDDFQLNQRMLFCEHTVINGILQYYNEMARIQNIEMSVNVNLPKTLPIPDVDICSLFCNAIENALEACERMKDGKRWIEIKADVFGSETYTIRFANSYEGELRQTEDGTFLSSKRNEEGIGVTSMKKICENYHGICKITHDDTSFIVEMMLMAEQHEVKL